jgi:hypothetical protein
MTHFQWKSLQKELSTGLILLLGGSGILLALMTRFKPASGELDGLLFDLLRIGLRLAFIALFALSTTCAVWFHIRNWKKAADITIVILFSLVCMFILWIVTDSDGYIILSK